MADEPSPLRRRYVEVWQQLLVDWLGWSADRFTDFVARYDADLNDAGNPLFYHYDELYYVLRYLVPNDLAAELSGRNTEKQFYNDLAALESEVGAAITGRPHLPTWGRHGFDWDAARARPVTRTQAFDLG